MDRYFSGGSGTATPTTSPLDGQLNQMFDKLRGQEYLSGSTLALLTKDR